MSPSAQKSPRVGLSDLLAIPEVQRRHEVVEATLIEKGAASGEHGATQRKLSAYVDPFDRRLGGKLPGGWWFATEVEVFFDEANVFRPDVLGWKRDRVAERPRGTPVRIRPDWVAEILSTNRHHDLIRKKRVYHRHQVPHYWVLDPDAATLTVYRWSDAGYVELLVAERGETVSPEPFESLPIEVGSLFGDDPA